MKSFAAKTISSRENFLRAIEFNSPHWTPIIFELLPAVWKKYGEGLDELALRYPDIFEGFEKGWRPPETDNPLYREGERLIDDWGCTWYNAQDGILGQVVSHPLEDWAKLNSLKVPDPAEKADWKKLKEHKKSERDMGLPVIGFPESFAHGGFFDRMQFLRGLENLLVDFMTEPPELHELIEIVLQYNMRYIDLWLEMDIVDDLIECGVSMHDPQVRANTIDGIVKHYRGKMCALVDIDEQMLPYGTPDEIEDQVREVIERVGTSEGGLMLYAIPSRDVPLENIEALCQAWKKYGSQCSYVSADKDL